MTYTINPLRILKDNFVYSIEDITKRQSVVIDAGDADAILKNTKGSQIEALLLTHHHFDHVGGAQQLQRAGCKLFGAMADRHRLPALDGYLRSGETFAVLDKLPVEVLGLPGHTIGHIGFYFPSLSAVFVGDILFTLGCGRMFEGDPETFFQSLQTIKSLPKNTRIYAGHDYTRANIAFTRHVLENLEEEYCLHDLALADVQAYLRKWENFVTEAITAPAILEEECRYNLFLRARTPAEFLMLRRRKDEF